MAFSIWVFVSVMIWWGCGLYFQRKVQSKPFLRSFMISIGLSIVLFIAQQAMLTSHQNTNIPKNIVKEQQPLNIVDDETMSKAIQTIYRQEGIGQSHLNPTKHPSKNIHQTEDFLKRIERLRREENLINLQYEPDVAIQSRQYLDLVEEAERVYGFNDRANPYRHCTDTALAARELWGYIAPKPT